MNNEQSLPADLQQMEQEIGLALRLETTPGLNHRIARAVHVELRRERMESWWKFCLGLAAAAFFWLHLSYYVVPATYFYFHVGPSIDWQNTGPFVPWAANSDGTTAVEPSLY
jgi:hypothetical protein